MKKRVILMVAGIGMARMVLGGIICSGDSASVAIDSRLEPVVDSINISWDASWVGGDVNAMVVIADNGTEVKCTTGTGEFTHTLLGGGRHELTYTTYIDGMVQSEVYATTVYAPYGVVTFDTNGGSVDETNRIVNSGCAVGELPMPMLTGHTFVGWWTSANGGTRISVATTVKDNVTYYAHWTTNSYTVTFDANGGTGGTSAAQNYGTTITAPTVIRTGYTFKGWSPTVAATVPDNDVTYTAQWQVNQYTVTFDANGGVGGTSVTQDYGTAVAAPDVRRENYMLVGWSPAFSSTMPAEKTTYVAQWLCKWICTTNADDTLKIIGVNFTPVGSVAIPLEIDGYYVKEIGPSVFDGCSGLTGVTIPDGVTSIGSSAFSGCSGLTSVTIPQLVCNNGLLSVFPSSYSAITNIVISDSVKSLRDFMFLNCSNLTSVTIPMMYDFGNNDLRNVGRLAEGKEGMWIQGSWLMGYIGEAPAEVVVPEGVEGIASYAFEGQTGLEKVSLPSTLKYIGMNAFRGCTSLEEIEIPDSVVKIDNGAFKHCTWLQDLKLPEHLEIIGKEAFANCAMLPNLECADGLTTIGEQAFSNCWRMLSVNLPVSLTNVDKTSFADCKRLTGVQAPTHLLPFRDRFPAAYTNITTVVVPEGETDLMDRAFMGCKALVDVSLPQSITQMGSSVFSNCTALVEISLPDGIARIENSAFSACVALEDVKLPKQLREIGAYAFYQCSALEHLTLPNTLEKIGDYAFYGDARLEEINLPGSLKHVGSYAFYNCTKMKAASFADGLLYLGAKAYGYCSSVRDVYIPSSVTNIGGSVFYNCSAITNITTVTAHRTMANLFPSVYSKIVRITIAPGETNLCDSCFSGCSKLVEIGLPDSVTTMGSYAFSGCSALSRVSLSQHLMGLPDYAFRNCISLTTLTVPESVSSLGKNVFDGCTQLESIYFVGNAPQYDAAVFNGIASGVTVFVVNGSMGWDGVATSRALPDSWPTSNSREITYWEPNRFNVIFDANGGMPATNVIEEITGMTYALPVPEPTMAGSTFLGWWTERVNGAQVTAGTQVTLTRLHTFYAHWAGNLYHVAVDANGGFGEMAERTCVVGESAELPLNVFARPGFAFAGWALEPEGEAVYHDGNAVQDLTLESDATVTLYAVWNEQAWATGDYMNAPGRMFVMGDGEGWTNDVVVSHDGAGSMRSGAIGLESESVISTTVVGEGMVSFWWKVSCEETYKGERYDYVYFAIDGVEQVWLAGEVDWTNVTFHVTGTGQHTLTWCYHKDDYDEPGYAGDDCAWIDEFSWVPAAVTATFDGNGNTAGSAPRDVVRYEGYSLTMPGAGTLERLSYVFAGWSDGARTYTPGSIYVFTGVNVAFSAVWIEKVWTYADFLNCDNLLFTTSVGAKWLGDFTTNHDWVVSARSATIVDGESSWIQGTVSGAGTLSFWTKVSGETKRGRLYDYLDVTIDSESVFAAAVTDWTNVVVAVSGGGEHTIRWTYRKDVSNSVGFDCAWLDEVTWTPSGTSAGLDVWLAERNLTADAQAANGRTAAECYALGLDPTDATNDFRIVSIEMVDGEPKVEWVPKTNRWTGAEIPAVLKGAAALEGPWADVPAGGNPAFRFFKVVVVVP